MEAIFAQLESLALPDLVKDYQAFLPSPMCHDLLVSSPQFSFDSLPNLTAMYRSIAAATTDACKLSANQIVYEVMCACEPGIQFHPTSARIAALDRFKERLVLDLVDRGLFKQYGLESMGIKVQELQAQLAKDCTDTIMSRAALTYLAHCTGRNIVVLDIDACDRQASKTSFELNIAFVKQGAQISRLGNISTTSDLDTHARLCVNSRAGNKKSVAPQKLAAFIGVRGRGVARADLMKSCNEKIAEACST